MKMEPYRIRHRAAAHAAALAALLTAALASTNAFAVAGFARQTGMSCNQCHLSHGAATPNFTFTGRKFRALGYRLPHVQTPDIKKNEPQDQGEYLRLMPSQWSGRFQWQGVSNVKPPAGPNAGKWGEDQTNPTTRFAVFPFIGPIGDHFGVWTEIYLVPESSATGQWTIANGSWDEHDFRYTINPNSRKNIYGIALTNQAPQELFGFGPWPAVGLYSGWSNRGLVGGYAHPNFGSLMAYGWMNDRWVWAFGENTGDTNTGWTKSNEIGMFGWALKRGFSHELWANMYFRTGNDVEPLVTRNSVPADKHDWYYSDSIGGVSATRPAVCPETSQYILSGCPYLAEDVDSATSVAAELRWQRQDVGDWSWEIVGRVESDTEKYLDGAKTDQDTWGVATQFGWKHRYYIKPYVNGHSKYKFRDLTGTEYDIDTSPTYGIWLAYKPVENFLLSVEYHRLQSWSLTGNALDDGARYSITADISF
jgi:hypothetical protein